MKTPQPEQEPPLEQVLGSAAVIDTSRVEGEGPAGRLPLIPDMLRHEPSGNIFGLTQNAGMGWRPDALGGPQYVIVSTMGGLRSENGEPIALGYHTGHWIGLLVRGAAEALRAAGAIPFSVYCSDPCDGCTQGTTGMVDSLAYRNDAAIVMRRLIRSLPTAAGVLGIATCDKGLPATMLALAGTRDLPGVIVPGGVTLPARGAEDAGQVQSLGARFAHDLISLDYGVRPSVLGRRGIQRLAHQQPNCRFRLRAGRRVVEEVRVADSHHVGRPRVVAAARDNVSAWASAGQRLHDAARPAPHPAVVGHRHRQTAAGGIDVDARAVADDRRGIVEADVTVECSHANGEQQCGGECEPRPHAGPFGVN